MRYFDFSAAILLAFAAMLTCLPVSAGEQLGYPPPDPPGTVRPAMNEENVQKELDQRLVDRFKAAAGSSPRLTAQQAKDAGWGFIADHFDQIDKKHHGYVTFDEIQAFMDGRSPGNPAKIRRQNSTIQKIE